MIIRLRVFEQTLSIVNTRSVPRKGSKEYLALQFVFSSDWKDLEKICYLQNGEVSLPIDVVDNLVEVPEWFTEQDSFDVTLFGKSGNQEVPTNVVALQLEKSNTLWEQDAPEPQPSWLAKVIDLNNHPPIPGNNGYWMLWDTDKGEYVESELPSGGSGSVAVDSTLTVSGQAADAKAVGDAINRVNSAIEAKQDHLTEHDKQEIVLTGLTTGAIWTDTEKQQTLNRLAIIKNALDDGIAVTGAQYYLGERKTVLIVLPDYVEPGDMITVSWYNGDTAATLSITGTMLGFDFVPSANTRSEINALWDGRYWAVLGNEIAVPSEVTT